MKNLIFVIVVLLVGACLGWKALAISWPAIIISFVILNPKLRRFLTKPRGLKGRELTAEEKKVVGTYEDMIGEETLRAVFLENGIFENYIDAKNESSGKWKISKEGELDTEDEDGGIGVFRINNDSSMTYIAEISGGKRTDAPKEEQFTLKIIK